ncbi:hypothetical protein FORC31_p355 (plasmid) [Escherichia coli]|nr:hypothetical protein FORC31_p355 [Escherichia coli]
MSQPFDFDKALKALALSRLLMLSAIALSYKTPVLYNLFTRLILPEI